jgi:hypothetical protein
MGATKLIVLLLLLLSPRWCTIRRPRRHGRRRGRLLWRERTWQEPRRRRRRRWCGRSAQRKCSGLHRSRTSSSSSSSSSSSLAKSYKVQSASTTNSTRVDIRALSACSSIRARSMRTRGVLVASVARLSRRGCRLFRLPPLHHRRLPRCPWWRRTRVRSAVSRSCRRHRCHRRR